MFVAVLIFWTRACLTFALVQAFRPKMAVLGSREQMCIHDEVRLLRGRAQNNACHYLCKKRLCRNYSRVSGTNVYLMLDILQLILFYFAYRDIYMHFVYISALQNKFCFFFSPSPYVLHFIF